MSKIKYTKNVLWLKPFVDSARDLISLKKITNIRGYKVRKGCEEKAYGSTIYKKGLYSINLKTHNLIEYNRYVGSTISTVLDTLAHELAHVKAGFEHSPEHYELTCRIALNFSYLLKENGIIDTSLRIDND